MLTKLLNNEKKNNSLSLKGNESLILAIDFSGTPLEMEVMTLKNDFINVLFSNITQMEIVKNHYDSSIEDLKILDEINENKNKDMEELIKLAKYTTEKIHSRVNEIKEFNIEISKENEKIITNLNQLSTNGIKERNKVNKMQKDAKDLETEKLFLKIELNESLNFFQTFFSIFYDFKSETKDKLKQVERKLMDMKNNMSDTEMDNFINKTKELETVVLNASNLFNNFNSKIKILESASNELLMIDFTKFPDHIKKFSGLCKVHLAKANEFSLN